MFRSLASRRTFILASRAASAASPRLRSAARTTTTARRSYYYYSPEGLPPTNDFTPGEECMLDATAWMVAFALCWAPAHEFDDLDHQHWADLQAEEEKDSRNNNKKNKKQRQEDVTHKDKDHKTSGREDDHHGKH